MPKKSDIKAVGAVVIGVVLAGLIMAKFNDVGIIGAAHSGFDS